jgi:putative NADPH-quinone reductase
MARRIAIIQGHPDAESRRLCHALGDAYAEGAEVGGHGVARVDVAALAFPLLQTEQEFEQAALPAELRPAQDAIMAAEHLVLVFPLWFGTMPTLVRAFLEHVMRPAIGFTHQPGVPSKRRLGGRSARLVVTMAMPVPACRWWFVGRGMQGLELSILGLAGIRPIRESLFGMVGTAGDTTRGQWLQQMRGLGARGI